MPVAAAGASRAAEEGFDLPPGVFFTLREIRDLTKLSLSKLYDDVAAGVLPALRRGRSIRIRRADLLRYLAGD